MKDTLYIIALTALGGLAWFMAIERNHEAARADGLARDVNSLRDDREALLHQLEQAGLGGVAETLTAEAAERARAMQAAGTETRSL